KGDQFPVNGTWVFSPDEGLNPDDLDRIEQPLLLHPYRKDLDPRRHLKFIEDGQVAARDGSPYGTCSIKVYDLNRDDLCRQREEQQRAAWREFLDAAKDLRTREAVPRITTGREPYSAACLDFIKSQLPTLTDSLGVGG